MTSKNFQIMMRTLDAYFSFTVNLLLIFDKFFRYFLNKHQNDFLFFWASQLKIERLLSAFLRKMFKLN